MIKHNFKVGNRVKIGFTLDKKQVSHIHQVSKWILTNNVEHCTKYIESINLLFNTSCIYTITEISSTGYLFLNNLPFCTLHPDYLILYEKP